MNASITSAELDPRPASRAERVGVLLINLGTPDAPRPPEVRRYLREFLSDPRVVDIHPVARWLLLNLVILPFRPARSAEAYRQIWTDAGSPLRVYGEALRDGVAASLGGDFRVELAMRYGSPSIPDAVGRLREADVERIVVVPLFPQYSSAASGSALARVYEVVEEAWNVPAVQTVPPFFDEPEFIEAFADVARPELEAFAPDYVLFSYHGVPVRQIEKSDPTGEHCLRSEECCVAIGGANRFCYRAHCYATTRALAARLGLTEDEHSVAFQSRLGRTPWIRPYTDEVLTELARGRAKRVAVICPTFVADCLETLEEIAIRGREDFRAAGGEDLLLVSSLNAHPSWIRGVASMVRKAAQP